MQKVPFLVGPTAAGKTAISIRVAEVLGAEIISADSRQLYRGMSIGTAQPKPEELSRIRHYFVACLDLEANFSAGEYSRQARAKIIDLLQRGVIPLVVGGSGLYISALADDFFSGPGADPEIRHRLKRRAAAEGVLQLYRELQNIDFASAEKIQPNDYRRIERALEIYYLTGTSISELRRQKANPPPFEPVMVGLSWPRLQLYARINARCLAMLRDGLVEELRRLVTWHFSREGEIPPDCNALNSVGYAEVLQYLRGEIDYGEMVRLFQRNTRRFAKRQLSWFKRDERIIWIEMNENMTLQQAAEQVLSAFRRRGIPDGSG